MRPRRIFLLLALTLVLAGLALGLRRRALQRTADLPSLESHALTAGGYMWGVTVDRINGFNATLEAVRTLPPPVTVRVVFDPGMAPSYYEKAVRRLHSVAGVMGEVVDSSAMAQLSRARHKARFQNYLTALKNDVDIWEVGNEVNGDWMGPTASVAAKVNDAFDLVHAAGLKSAVTLFYNTGCVAPSMTVFEWPKTYLSEALRQGVTYVFVSYYRERCQLAPNWPDIVNKLGILFPNSFIGIGECGTRNANKKEAFLRTMYGLRVDHPRFVGGYFWWYFYQDMVPNTKPLWSVLSDLIAEGHQGSSVKTTDESVAPGEQESESDDRGRDPIVSWDTGPIDESSDDDANDTKGCQCSSSLGRPGRLGR